MLPFLPPALPAQGPQDLDAGLKALHAGRPAEALALLDRWLGAHPADSDALVGSGFALLRLERLPEAKQRFERALAAAPRYADAHYGLGLCLLRRGEAEAAKASLRRGLELEPGRADLKAALDQALEQAPDPLPPAQRPAALQMPARTHGRAFEVRDASGAWKPLFLKGMNLGAALPGKYPSEFPDKATYQGWIRDMAELGINALRVYTLHPPGFYEALAEHNATAKQPIWLIHGVWTELPPEDDFRDPAWWADWKAEMIRVVDVLHGHAQIPARPGHAAGRYTADVSRWTLAIILGREWEPFSVVAFNQRHPGESDWSGRFVKVRRGHATEVFMAEAMETFLAYEKDAWNSTRPMAFTNWPTLDPLTHPTEATKEEEALIRKRQGLPSEEAEVHEYDNDALGLDMEKYDALPACPAGLFASYHAYPYYPDFMNLDPGYDRARDARGRNNYAGYLRDLVAHHRKHPTLVAEFGVPSSRLVAHWQPQGFTHGGQTEQEQGDQDARLFEDIHGAGCAGGLLFAWIDEWFKKNWLVIEFEEPLERKPYWYNAQDAEENYGLIAMVPGAAPRIVLDGKAGDWKNVPDYQSADGLRVKLACDEGWLYLALFRPGGPLDWTKEAFTVGLDTYSAKLGDHRLPDLALPSEAGFEFAVRFHGPGDTALRVDEPYELLTHRYHRPYRTRENAAGRYLMPMTESNRARLGRDGTAYPPRRQEIGWMKRGTTDRRSPVFDSRAEWMEGTTPEGEGFLEARIPWGLLNFTDPSSHRVVQEGAPPYNEVQTAATEGIRAVTVRTGADGRQALQAAPAPVGGSLPLPPLFRWPGWERPAFHAVRKPSFERVKAALAALPDAPAPVSGEAP